MENIQYYSHLCACGCGGQIEIKKIHSKIGIPKYIHNHHWKGKKRGEQTESHRKKHSESKKGKKRTEEQRRNRSESSKGEDNPFYGKKHTEETKQKQSKIKKGKKVSKETKLKQSKAQKERWAKIPTEERKKSEELRFKISKGRKGKLVKEDHWNWNKGSSFEPYSPEFNKPLKQSILERDNYTCQCPDCTLENKKLMVHHINYDKKNSNPKNLITLCNKCHSKTNNSKNKLFWISYYQNIMEIKKNV